MVRRGERNRDGLPSGKCHSDVLGRQLLPHMVTPWIGGQVSAGRVRLHHVERRSPAAACAVYRDGTLIVKWHLDNQKAMKGAATRRILELIRELEPEGLL